MEYNCPKCGLYSPEPNKWSCGSWQEDEFHQSVRCKILCEGVGKYGIQTALVWLITIADNACSAKDFDFVNKLLKYTEVDDTNINILHSLSVVSWWPKNVDNIELENRQDFLKEVIKHHPNEDFERFLNEKDFS